MVHVVAASSDLRAFTGGLGEFDVTRGPYIGANDAGSGTVWVLRKLESEMTTQ